MAFQYKTLIRLAPAALLMIAFQNCAPQKFAQTTAASEKSFTTDGTAGVPADGSVVPAVPSSSTATNSHSSTETHHTGTDSETGDSPDSDKKKDNSDVDSHPKSAGQTRALNCKSLRDKFVAMKVKPAVLTSIKTSGQSEAGPFYISGVDKIESSGQSDVYVVGSDANAMAKDIQVSGSGHVVLCGVYAGNVKTSGNSVVDVIGANVLGNTKQSGNANIDILDQDGNPL